MPISTPAPIREHSQTTLYKRTTEHQNFENSRLVQCDGIGKKMNTKFILYRWSKFRRTGKRLYVGAAVETYVDGIGFNVILVFLQLHLLPIKY